MSFNERKKRVVLNGAQKQDVVNMYVYQRMELLDIAHYFNVTTTTVRNILRDADADSMILTVVGGQADLVRHLAAMGIRDIDSFKRQIKDYASLKAQNIFNNLTLVERVMWLSASQHTQLPRPVFTDPNLTDFQTPQFTEVTNNERSTHSTTALSLV